MSLQSNMEELNTVFRQGMDYLDKSKTFLDQKGKQCADMLDPERFESFVQITINRNMFKEAAHASDGTVMVRELKVSPKRSILCIPQLYPSTFPVSTF